MTIILKCPNGHSLKAQETSAGKTGKCPICKCEVHIPQNKRLPVTESAVLGIIGTPEPTASHNAPVVTTLARVSSKTSGTSAILTPTMPSTKACPACEKDIDTGYHICPHCHKYLT